MEALVVGGFCLVVYVLVFARRKQKLGPVSSQVEIHHVQGLAHLRDRLEQELSTTYMENVRQRMGKKLKENEWAWRYYELKRFFILCAILKETPMFSKKVDDVWHEMIMFTREYETFSHNYLQRTLHHEPNITKTNNGDVRGFFDWVYATLFPVHKESVALYKGFYRHPVASACVEEFQTQSTQELIAKYFSEAPLATDVVTALVEKMKQQAISITYYTKSEIARKKMTVKKDGEEQLILFLYYSCYEYKTYHHSAKGVTETDSAFLFDFPSYGNHHNQSSCSTTESSNSCSSSSCSSSSCSSSSCSSSSCSSS